MRRIFFYMLALVFLSGIGFAQTTATVSGHISAPNTVATTSQTQVIFELTNTGGQLCKVSGTTLVMPYFQTFSPQQILAGVTLYRNDAISCGTTTGGSRWKYTIKYGSASPNASVPQSVSCVLNIASSSINLDSTACLNAAPTPVVAVPTDALYARLDGTNAGFTGDLTFNGHNLSGLGNVSVGGTLGECIENGMYVAGSSCYATIAAARTAAGSNTVLIPSTYAGVDSVADGNNPVIDLRNNVFKASHFFGCAYPMTNAPGGLDCSYEANGAGDLVFKHNTHVNPSTTTAVTLNVGANTNFLVGSTALFGTGGTAPIIVGRDTANEETVGTGNWSIVDGTHLSITCAKSHGPGTTDIEQLGVTQIDPGIFIQLNAHKPAQFSGALFPPTRWNDPNGTTFMVTPGQSGATFPFGQILIASNTSISGFTAGAGSSYLNPADLNFRNASASNNVNFNNSSGTLIFRISDTQFLFGLPIVDGTAGAAVSTTGAIRFQNAHGPSWRNVGNSADLSLGVNAADGLAFNTAAVVGTIPYNVGVANLTAQSAAVGPTTIRAVGAAQAGTFRISWSAVVTTAATTSSTLGGANVGFQVTYTDNDTGAAGTTPLAAAPAAGTNTAYSQTNSQNTVGAQASGVVIVNAKASTNIQYNFGYTSVGGTAMQYALHVRIEPI